MSAEQNKARFREFIEEIINKRNIAKLDEYLTPDFVEHEVVEPFPATRDGVRQFFTGMLSAFPDLKVTINDAIAEGDKVVMRETWTGTHKSEFMGIPATGKRVEFSVIDIVHMKDGKATDHWGVSDTLKMMQQMGVVEAGV